MRIGADHFPGQPGQAVDDSLWLASEPFPLVRGDLPDDIAWRTIAILRPVVARRASGVGSGVASETVGPFSRTYTTQGGAAGLTRAEFDALRRVSDSMTCNPRKRVARTVAMYGSPKGETC